jgi:hypothetical protein
MLGAHYLTLSAERNTFIIQTQREGGLMPITKIGEKKSYIQANLGSKCPSCHAPIKIFKKFIKNCKERADWGCSTLECINYDKRSL